MLMSFILSYFMFTPFNIIPCNKIKTQPQSQPNSFMVLSLHLLCFSTGTQWCKVICKYCVCLCSCRCKMCSDFGGISTECGAEGVPEVNVMVCFRNVGSGHSVFQDSGWVEQKALLQCTAKPGPISLSSALLQTVCRSLVYCITPCFPSLVSVVTVCWFL